MIEAYVHDLERALPGPGRVRRRIVSEVATHLHDAAAEAVEAGSTRAEAELQAVARFGTVPDVVAGFRPMLVCGLVLRASLVFVAGVLLAAPAALVVSENLLPPATWPTDALPHELALKQDFAAAALAAALVLALTAAIAARSTHLRLALAAAGLAAGALFGAAGVWIALARQWSQLVPGAGGAFVASTAVALGLLVPAAALAVAVARAARGASAAG